MEPRRISEIRKGSSGRVFDAVIVIPRPGPRFGSFTVKIPLDGTIVSATSNSISSVILEFESFPRSRIELIS